MRTADRTFSQLCEEIDVLREEVEYWKGMYKKEVAEQIQETNKRLEESKKGIANALMFALAVKDDENGNPCNQ